MTQPAGPVTDRTAASVQRLSISGRILGLKEAIRSHPLGAGTLSLFLFVTGAVAGSAIDRGLESMIPDQATEAARAQQALIAERTASIGLGVESLRMRIEALSADASGAELAAIRADAAQILAQMREVTPVLSDAASRNAALAANMRARDLEETGASTLATLVIPDNSSATVCGDFTVGVMYSNNDTVRMNLSRRGETATVFAGTGEAVALEQADASASVSLAGIRGVDPYLLGLDFNCYPGKPQA